MILIEYLEEDEEEEGLKCEGRQMMSEWGNKERELMKGELYRPPSKELFGVHKSQLPN